MFTMASELSLNSSDSINESSDIIFPSPDVSVINNSGNKFNCRNENEIATKTVISDSEPSVFYDESSYFDESFIGNNRKKLNRDKFIIISDSDGSSSHSSPGNDETSKSSIKIENEDKGSISKIRSSVSFNYDNEESCDEEVANLLKSEVINQTSNEKISSISSILMLSDSSSDTYEFKSEISDCETEIASYRSSKSDGSKNSVHLSLMSSTKNSMNSKNCSVSSFGDSEDETANNGSAKEEGCDSVSEQESGCHSSGADDDDISVNSDELPEFDVEALARKRSISPVKEFPIQSGYQVIYTGPLSMERLIQLQMEAERITKRREEAIQRYKQLKETQVSSMPANFAEVIELITAIKNAERKAKRYSERLAFLNKKISNKPDTKESKTIFDNNLKSNKIDKISNDLENKKDFDINIMLGNLAINNMPSISSDISEFGKQALETHNRQRDMTMDALKRMHQGLAVLENPESVKIKDLKVELLPHQKFALNWMSAREKEQRPSGGILADDMGLGKTITMLSLIASSKQVSSSLNTSDSSSDEDEDSKENKRSLHEGGTLIICPASVIGQWENEIKSKVKAGVISYIVHHGPKRETKESRLCRFDVVLSTYTILQQSNKENNYGPLLNIRWNRIVLDEAHSIRNHTTRTAVSAFLLKGKNRWCLTGTPIQNKSQDLFSLLKFLRCRPFDDIVVWKRWIDNKDAAGAHRLSCITKSILLRRTKAEIENLDLKTKTIDLVKIHLDPEEMDVYKKVAQLSGALFAQFIQQKAEKEDLFKYGAPILNTRKPLTQQDNPFTNHPEMEKLFNEMISMGKGIKSVEILLLLLRLRQLCCHPSLITKMFDKLDLETENDELVEADGTDVNLVDRMMNVSISCVSSEKTDPPNEDKANCLSKNNPVFKKERVSSKVRKVIEYLKEKVLSSSEDKALIISQFTSVLDILEEELIKLKLKYCSLTGKVKVSERGDIIAKFNTPAKGPRVMLLSLVAGGTGLNLVGANHLLFVDAHWNPQLENQAFDRVYRIGQTKDVFIYKFICEDTIEERIMKLQESKLKLAENVLTGASKISSTKLTMDDLKMLFQVKDK